MRRQSNYEQLVEQYKQELLADEKRISQIELQLESKHEKLVSENRVN